MSDNLKPDLHEDARGWASLPPESRSALYPLLQKKRYTGRDIARILMFNAIASYNGNRVLDEDTIRSMAASMTDAGWKVYNKYMAAFFTLSKSVELVSQLAENTITICQLLELNIENALHENLLCPDCSSRRYDINSIANFRKDDSPNKSVITHNKWHTAWIKGKEIITYCAIERLMFKTAGLTLNVPGLEAMLTKDIVRLQKIIKDHADFTMKARKSFNRLNLTGRISWVTFDWTQPLPDIDSITVPDKAMREARRKLRLDTFAYDYNMLDNVFRPYLD